MTTQAMLDDARAAYHRIVTGVGLAEARGPDGRMAKWHPGNLTELRRYINQLEGELGLPITGFASGPRQASLRVMF